MNTNSVESGTKITSVIESPAGGLARPWDANARRRVRAASYFGYIGLLTLLFVQTLVSLFAFAAGSSLHSHIPLVPLIAGYLLYTRPRTRPTVYSTSPAGTGILALVGILAMLAAFIWRADLSGTDRLVLMVFAYVSFVAAGGFLFLGGTWMRGAAFPLAFLIFMVPLPEGAERWLENALVLGSAEASALLFSLAGTSFVRTGTVFELPGIVLEVGRECSGIHSSWVLFITSVLASNLFLRSPWRRVVLVAFVIPLGIIRNGFRILVIALLCVHVGPHMIDSAIHRQGGPLFFALSLVPLFALLWWLRRREQRATVAR